MNAQENTFPQTKELKYKIFHEVPRGLLRHVILNLLNDKTLNGVEISQIIEEITKRKWSPSAGSLYPILASLEHRGFIEIVSTEGRSKFYQITNLGKTHLERIREKHPELETNLNTMRNLFLLFFHPENYWKFLLRDLQTCITSLVQESQTLNVKKRKKIREKIDSIITQLQKLQTTLNMD